MDARHGTSASRGPAGAHPTGARLWADVAGSLAADRAGYSPGARALRALRLLRVAGLAGVQRRLSANPAYRRHVSDVAPGDHLFWISHRAYLARGLSPGQRAALALAHYEEVAHRGASYLDRVHAPGGLELWGREARGARYDIRLMPGNDVLYEGGLSLVMHVDGGRVCVVSFSWVPGRLVLGEAGDARLPFVTRKHLAADHGYQAAFHRAFDRTTAAHLCLGALSGLCTALGRDRLLGISGARHPAVSASRLAHFRAGYDDFWAGLGGRRANDLGWLVDLPLRGKPLDGLDAARRKRALARRAHVEEVRRAAEARFREATGR